MNSFSHTDDELAERISRGDWALDVEPPAIDDVMLEVEQRQRRRRTAIGVSVVGGLAAAAAVTAVVGLSPSNPSADVPPVQGPTVSKPTADRPTVSEPTPTVTRLPDCRHTRSRMLMTSGRYGGTTQRPSQVVMLGNIGHRACSIPVLPKLSVGNTKSMTPVEVRSGGDGPWVLKPQRALILTVTAPPPATCSDSHGREARKLAIEQGGFTYTFGFPGMHIAGCAAPLLSGVRVGAASPSK